MLQPHCLIDPITWWLHKRILQEKKAARLVNDAEVMSGGTGLATRSSARHRKIDETLGHRRFCRAKPRLPITIRELQKVVIKRLIEKSEAYLAKH